jgi:predicted anti-sigma-YlaC factor YlaD
MAESGLSCAELVELVNDYLDGALAPADRSRFDEHLEECDGCRNYLEQMRITIGLTGRLRIADLSTSAQADLIAAFRSYRGNSPG